MAKLFIVGFPKDMQEVELVEMFSAHGIVNTVTIVTDQNTGDSKGYGFITMTDEADAQRAIQAMDGATIDSRTISVRLAEEKQPAKTIVSPRPQQTKPAGSAAPRKPHRSAETQTSPPPAVIRLNIF